MAREYGRVWLSIWSDSDFIRLDMCAQWLYLALLSQPSMTTCGVQPYTPNRWAGLVPALNARRAERAVRDLEGAGLIIADRTTDELAVRSHLRYDKPLRSANTAKAFARTWSDVRSARLRRAVLIELQRLHDEHEFPTWAGWEEHEIKHLVATDLRTIV